MEFIVLSLIISCVIHCYRSVACLRDLIRIPFTGRFAKHIIQRTSYCHTERSFPEKALFCEVGSSVERGQQYSCHLQLLLKDFIFLTTLAKP